MEATQFGTDVQGHGQGEKWVCMGQGVLERLRARGNLGHGMLGHGMLGHVGP